MVVVVVVVVTLENKGNPVMNFGCLVVAGGCLVVAQLPPLLPLFFLKILVKSRVTTTTTTF